MKISPLSSYGKVRRGPLTLHNSQATIIAVTPLPYFHCYTSNAADSGRGVGVGEEEEEEEARHTPAQGSTVEWISHLRLHLFYYRTTAGTSTS